jgi:DNA-directed RNA polymerase subunit RPC12/RpoP
MKTSFTCPICKENIELDENINKKEISCPYCAEQIKVPEQEKTAKNLLKGNYWILHFAAFFLIIFLNDKGGKQICEGVAGAFSALNGGGYGFLAFIIGCIYILRSFRRIKPFRAFIKSPAMIKASAIIGLGIVFMIFGAGKN